MALKNGLSLGLLACTMTLATACTKDDDTSVVTETDCEDGIDDDEDGDIDCDDSDCDGDAACDTDDTPTNETDCDDGVDEDEDGLTDCDDPDCTSDPACEVVDYFDPIFFTVSAAFAYDPDSDSVPATYKILDGTDIPAFIQLDFYSQAHIDSGWTDQNETCAMRMSYDGTEPMTFENFSGSDWVGDTNDDGNPQDGELGQVSYDGFTIPSYTVDSNCDFREWDPAKYPSDPTVLLDQWDWGVGVGDLNPMPEDTIAGSSGGLKEDYDNGLLGGGAIVSDWIPGLGWPSSIFSWTQASSIYDCDESFQLQGTDTELIQIRADDAFGGAAPLRGIYSVFAIFILRTEWML